MTPAVIAHIKGTARARSLAFFIPRANVDLGLSGIINAINNITTRTTFATVLHILLFKDNALRLSFVTVF